MSEEGNEAMKPSEADTFAAKPGMSSCSTLVHRVTIGGDDRLVPIGGDDGLVPGGKCWARKAIAEVPIFVA